MTKSIGREAPLPSLRGALATKQSSGRVMRPLDCFAALAMTGGELARSFLGVALLADRCCFIALNKNRYILSREDGYRRSVGGVRSNGRGSPATDQGLQARHLGLRGTGGGRAEVRARRLDRALGRPPRRPHSPQERLSRRG